MTLFIRYFGGRTESFKGVRYVSAYPMSSPQIMRVEFHAICNVTPSAMTIDLTAVENFATRD